MRKIKIIKNQKGTTLVELLVYMGLMSIMLLILTDILVALLNMKLETQMTSSVEQDGRFIQQRILYDINRADEVNSPILGASSQSLLLDIGNTVMTYSLSSGNLQFNDTLGVYNINSSETSVSNLSFLRIGNTDGNNTIKVEFTVEAIDRTITKTESKNYEFSMGVR